LRGSKAAGLEVERGLYDRVCASGFERGFCVVDVGSCGIESGSANKCSGGGRKVEV